MLLMPGLLQVLLPHQRQQALLQHLQYIIMSWLPWHRRCQ
jgi:hypothetical protein